MQCHSRFHQLPFQFQRKLTSKLFVEMSDCYKQKNITCPQRQDTLSTVYTNCFHQDIVCMVRLLSFVWCTDKSTTSTEITQVIRFENSRISDTDNNTLPASSSEMNLWCTLVMNVDAAANQELGCFSQQTTARSFIDTTSFSAYNTVYLSIKTYSDVTDNLINLKRFQGYQ